VIVFVSSSREARSPMVGLMLTMLALMTSARFFGPRPQLFTYLALATLIAIALAARRGRPKLVFAALPLFPIWINFHAGAIPGVAFLAIFAICDAAEGRFRPGLADDERTQMLAGARTFGVTAAIAALLTLATPYSWHTYQNLLATIGNPVAMNLVGEWLSPDFHSEFGQLLEIYLFLTALAIGLSKERRSFADIALLLLLVHEALGANRNVPLLAIAGTPLLARHAVSALSRFMTRSKDAPGLFGPSLPAPVGAILLATSVLLAAVLSQSVVSAVAPGARMSLQSVAATSFQLSAFPSGASAFLERERFPTTMRLWNKYDDGGYLIWRLPEYKVLSDGRADVYFGRQLDDVARLNALCYDWQRILDSYGCDVVMISAQQKQARVFMGSPEWALVYVDRTQLDDPNFHLSNNLILVRRDPAHAALIAQCRRDCPAVGVLAQTDMAKDFPAFR